MTSTDFPATATQPDETILYCPACGYDLRASSEGRCSECGLVIDPATLRVSAFPWAHRREMGRVRAYVKTIWQVLIAARSLDYETAKPQDPPDARSFARVTGILLAIAAFAVIVAIMLAEDGMGAFALPPIDPTMPLRGMPPYWEDVLVPWAAGITLWPIMVTAVLMSCLALPRAARSLFRRRGATDVQNQRAAAIALYVTAPLALLLPCVLTFLAIALLEHGGNFSAVSPTLNVLLIFAAGAMGFVALLATFARTGQWLARVRHAGVLTGIAGAAGLLVLWVATLILWCVLVPWFAGFLWLVFDSLR